MTPESILVGEDGHVFISDFDDSVFLHDDVERHNQPQAAPSLICLEYQAPEMILGWEHDYAVDWWSFGLVLYWTLTGNVRGPVAIRRWNNFELLNLQHPFVNLRETEHPSIVRSKVLHARLTDDRLGMDEDVYQLIARVRFRHCLAVVASPQSLCSVCSEILPFALTDLGRGCTHTSTTCELLRLICLP